MHKYLYSKNKYTNIHMTNKLFELILNPAKLVRFRNIWQTIIVPDLNKAITQYFNK